MVRAFVFLVVLLFSVFSAGAQVTISDFDPGIIVLSSGDTLKVRIKPEREERMSKQIQVWDVNSNGPKRYQARELKFYSLNKQNFYSLKDEEGKSVFMEAKVEGDATLFSYAYREENGKKEVVSDYYVRKKGGGLIKVPTQPSRFRNDMALYFNDYPQLAAKITGKTYGYFDMEAVTEEYNAWTNSGKPKETRPDQQRDEPQTTGPKLVRNKVEQEKGSRFGLDVPVFATYNFVNYPTSLNQLYSTRTIGFGFDVGLGARIRLVRGLTMRAGINMRDKGMKISSDVLPVQGIDANGNVINFTLKVREQGRMYYPGIYLNLGQEWSHFHVGGGFNMSFYSFYRGSYTVESQYGNAEEDPANSSFIVHGLTDSEGQGKNFNMQFDIHMAVGGRIKVGEFITLKPTLMYAVPMLPLYNSGINVQSSFSNTELNVSGYQLKFGLITDLGFK